MKKKKLYSEKEYWSTRDNPNQSWTGESQVGTSAYKFIKSGIKSKKPILSNYLNISSKLYGAYKCLDFGPGTGRFIEAYIGLNMGLECYDVSDLYSKRLQDRANEYGVRINLTIGESSFNILPYKDKEFDVCVSTMVLLHISPNNILGVMKELSRVSKKVLIMSLYDKEKPFCEYRRLFDYGLKGEEYYTHVFNYDYPRICLDSNFKILNFEVEGSRRVFFTYS